MSNTTSPRLVALDLDGTLLNHQGQVTPRTRQAIAEAVARGIVVLPATGRPLSNLPPVVAQLTGVRYAITSNGAAVWDLGTDPMSAVYSRYCNAAEHRITEPVSLIARPMPVELAREAFALYMEYPGAMSVFCDGRTYRDTVAMERFARRNARRGSTEARQPNDGRFTVVRDLTECRRRPPFPASGPLPGPRSCRARRTTSSLRRRGWTRARPCWRWPTCCTSPAKPPWPWATARTTALCWKRPALPL